MVEYTYDETKKNPLAVRGIVKHYRLQNRRLSRWSSSDFPKMHIRRRDVVASGEDIPILLKIKHSQSESMCSNTVGYF